MMGEEGFLNSRIDAVAHEIGGSVVVDMRTVLRYSHSHHHIDCWPEPLPGKAIEIEIDRW